MKKLWRFARSIAVGFAMSLVLVLCGCGGSGGDSSFTPPVLQAGAPLRSDAFFAYYGDFDGQFAETKSHVNASWIWAWAAPLDQRLAEAVAAGITCNVVGLAGTAQIADAEDVIRADLTRWRAAGYLPYICGFTPVDEPGGAGHTSEAELRAWAAVMHKVEAEFPELHAKLFIMFDASDRAGFDAFDVIAWDDYSRGATVLGGELQAIEAQLRPDQMVAIVPGGWGGNHQDPAPFLAALESDPKIWGIVAFLYGDAVGQQGIKDDGLLPAYCVAGKTVVHPNIPAPTCTAAGQ